MMIGHGVTDYVFVFESGGIEVDLFSREKVTNRRDGDKKKCVCVWAGGGGPGMRRKENER